MDNTFLIIRELIETGKIEEAESALSEALQADPACQELLNLQAEIKLRLGSLCWEKGDVDRALDYLTRALEINSSDRNIVLKCGEILASLEQTDAAKNLYSSFLQKNADDEIAKALENLENREKSASEPSDETHIDKQANIRVSAIVSTYNSERFMRGCLKDLTNQTLFAKDQLEIIVIDSGSEQNEKAIVEEFQKKRNNIRYIRTERETVYAAWNRGIKLATGEYITNANTDDRHRRDALEVMANKLDQNPDIGLVYADVIETFTENEPFDKHTSTSGYRWQDYSRELLTVVCFMGPQPMWRKALHDRYGFFDESFTSSGDWEFWLRIAEGTQMLHIPEFLGLYLNSSQSIEHRNTDKKYHENLLIKTKYIPRYVPDFDKHFIKALKNDPVNQKDTFLYGAILTSFGRYEEAINLYSSFLKLAPSNQIIQNKLRELETAKEFKETPPEGSSSIVVAANLVPFKDQGQLERQQNCINSITTLIPWGIIPLNICFSDELTKPQGWEVAPVLSRSADKELKVPGKRKPFVTDLFDAAAEWAQKCEIKWFMLTNSDIIFTPQMTEEVRNVIDLGYETAAFSRSDIVSIDQASGIAEGYIEYNGSDVFLCNTSWWLNNRQRFQPYIFGERAWDNAFAAVMASHSRFHMSFKKNFCYHLKHPETWVTGPYADYNLSIFTGKDRFYANAIAAFLTEIANTPNHNIKMKKTGELMKKYFASSAQHISSQKKEAEVSLSVASPHPPVEQEQSRKLVSIIVASGNIDRFRNCIEKIRKYTPESYEVILVPLTVSNAPPKWLRRMIKENKNYRWVSPAAAPSGIKIDLSSNPPSPPFKKGGNTGAFRKNKAEESLSNNTSVSGYSSAWNTGIAESSGEDIVILDDSVLVTDHWLSSLLEVLKKSDDIGIVGPMIMGGEGPQGVDIKTIETYRDLLRLVETGKEKETHRDSLRLSKTQGELEKFAKDFRERNRHRTAGARKLSDSLIAFRRALFDKTGHFDERFYSPDFAVEDYCLRASLGGYRNVIAGDVLVFHQLENNVRIAKDKAAFKDRKQYFGKWGKTETAAPERQQLHTLNALNASDDLHHQGQHDKALAALIEGLKNDPQDERLHYALIKLLIEKKRFQDADDILKSLPDAMKQSVTWLELSGYCKEGLQAYDEALKHADALLGINGKSPKALNLRGLIAFRRDDPDRAEHFFRKALEADEGFGEAYANLGALHWSAEKYESAVGLFEQAFILSPSSEEIAFNYHAAAVSMSRLERSSALFKEASALYPTDKRLKYMFADILLQLERYHEAMEVLEEALLAFGMDDDSLALATALREKIGAKTIEKGSRIQGAKGPSEAEQVIPPNPPLEKGGTFLFPPVDKGGQGGVTKPVSTSSSPTLAKGGEGGFSEERFSAPADPPEAGRSLQKNGGQASRNDKPSDPRILESSKPTLSVCIIVKDEEHNIGTCLHKIEPLADEMIVVDTGSTDRTRDIARAFGAKVYDFKWTNSFSDARNHSLSNATGDWIFVLDADETIAPSDFEPLRKLFTKDPGIHGFKDSRGKASNKHHTPRTLQSSNPLQYAYSFISRNYVHPMNTVGWVSNDGTYLKEEAGTGWFSSKKVRLFPNDRRFRFEAPVHEYVEYSLLDAGIMIRACAIPVQHYGKLDMEKLKAKGEQYYELGKLKWEERGVEDPISIFELAVQASELGKFDEALVYFERVVTLVPTFPKALYGLGNTYYRLGKYEEAFSAMKKAIQIAEDDTNYRDAVTLFAHAALCIGKANEGIEYLKQFLNKYPDDPKYQNDSVIQLLFGISYLTTGSEETAMAHMQKLKELNPGAAYFLTDFVKVLLTSQQAETAMLVLKAAEKMNLATSEFPSLIDACEKKVAEMKEKDSRGQGSEAVT